jgi:mannan endo-1,4-beta-mannosidase
MLIKRIFALLFISLSVLTCNCGGGFQNFITTDKDNLKDGKETLRFISYNIPNLHYIEDYMKFDATNPWKLPDEFEIRDALRTIKQIGGNVTRIYVPSVRKQGESEKIIRHVEAPGKFNEEAFRVLDKVLQIANEEKIRIILPLVDNWWWWGGPKEYASFRGKDAKEFWTDSLLISDFKKTVKFILNRKNTYTGVLYKDDKALLGWETGNELGCPFSWNALIAKYIKSLDKNHLVIQGTNNNLLTDEAVKDTNIDVLTTHHYGRPSDAIQRIVANKLMTKGKKPYFVGEFGFMPTPDVKTIIDTVINNNVSGIMIWSLRGHNSEGGFYYHAADNGGTAYHWPGFESGAFYDEKNVMKLMRESAYKINGKEIPPIPAPEMPNLLNIETPFKISWQGSTGASSYLIERREENSDWKTLIDSITDAVYPYTPQFSDTSVLIGKSYYYRMKARNESGISGYSNVIGPVKVGYKILIDDMENDKKIFKKDGDLEFLKFQQIVQAREDRNRLQGKNINSIIYKVKGVVKSIKVDFYLTNKVGDVQLFAAADTDKYSLLNMKKVIYVPEKNEYELFIAGSNTSTEVSDLARYLKVIFNEGVQIGRIEIVYNDTLK